MNSIFQLPVTQGLGWALLHFLWQGALIALALTASLALLHTSHKRYTAASTAMTMMVLVFGGTWIYSTGAFANSDTAAPIGTALASPRTFDMVLVWIVPLWATGAFLIGLYRLVGWLTLQRIRQVGVPVGSPMLRQRLLQLTQKMGLSRVPLLLESHLADGPIVVGVLRPTIIFPIGLMSGLPISQVETILLHEMAHVRRFDYLINLMQTVVESLLFYHPAIWWVSRCMRTERENCCDDIVVEMHGSAREYAAALVALEERRSSGSVPAPAATGGILMKRIHRILHPAESPRSTSGLVVSLGLLMSVFCMLGLAQQTDTNSSWLNEEVVYIIENQEREAFERLKTDEERDRFVEQFWERRDPTPGTPTNEQKDEHYRRIEFANERFAAEDPGWQTDRGRLYIVYGPPDEIETHPSGGEIQVPAGNGSRFNSTNSFEAWRYRHIEGIGDDVRALFVDIGRSGKFQLISGPTIPAAE